MSYKYRILTLSNAMCVPYLLFHESCNADYECVKIYYEKLEN